MERISFRDTVGRDFSLYEGEWEVSDDGGGTRVDYRLKAKPLGGMPAAMVGPILRSSLEQMLSDTRAEIDRRTRSKR